MLFSDFHGNYGVGNKRVDENNNHMRMHTLLT